MPLDMPKQGKERKMSWWISKESFLRMPMNLAHFEKKQGSDRKWATANKWHNKWYCVTENSLCEIWTPWGVKGSFKCCLWIIHYHLKQCIILSSWHCCWLWPWWYEIWCPESTEWYHDFYLHFQNQVSVPEGWHCFMVQTLIHLAKEKLYMKVYCLKKWFNICISCKRYSV